MDNSLITQVDRSKLFLGYNKFESGTIATPDAELTIAKGQVMGRVAADNTITNLKSAASDGSQFPLGIAAQAQVVPASTVGASITVCIAGDVDEALIVYDGTDDAETVVSSRTLGDRLKSDTLGINPLTVSDNTIADNE